MKYSRFDPPHTSIFFASLLFIACILSAGCTTSSYFKTPNDVYKMNGAIFMEDGTRKNGRITILYENNLDVKQSSATFISEGDSISQKISADQIKYYTINDNVYVPKKIRLYMVGQYHLLFVKRLTRESDRMQLYELHQSFKSNDTGEEEDYYFVSFPGFSKYEVIDINSQAMIPGLETKIAGYIGGCTQLINKITSKQKGYYYGTASLRGKREEVIKNIVRDYNACE